MGEASKLRFNCYLLREDITDPQNAFRFQYRIGGRTPMQELPSEAGIPEGCRAFFSSKKDGEPPWARSLSQFFPNLGDVKSVSHRLVIFLPVGDRTFAVCFGYGSSTLEWSRIEANFGLRFASRAYNTLALNEIRSRRIDPSARTQSIQIPNRTGLREFDVELEGEFIRRVVGELDQGVETSDLGAVVATDSIAFKLETDLNEVKRILDKMLDTVSQKETTDELRFIDSLEPLRSKDELTSNLEKLLAQSLFGDRATKQSTPQDEDVAALEPYLLSFAPPDDLTVENVHTIRVKRGDEVGYMDEMRIESLLSTLSSFRGRFGPTALRDIRVMAVDSEGEPASSSTSLKNWLIFEAGSDEKRYLLTLGKWFALAENYARQLDDDLAGIDDVTDLIQLKEWNKEEYKEKPGEISGETKYNLDQIAGRDDLVRLDTDTIPSLGRKIEACDLLHADGYLIHVKKYSDSQTLSHLFSQGYVAAQTLTDDPEYRHAFIEKVEGLSADFTDVATEAPQKVTFAIAVEGDREIPSSLPTFSKVNLRGFVRKLRRMQVQPSLARIQML